MNPNPRGQPPRPVSWKPNLTGLRRLEREAYQLTLELLGRGEMPDSDKLRFLRAVETLSGAVRAQAGGSMDDYFPKTVLAKKIETFILEEASEQLTNNVCQQAMLCIVALSQVDPPFSLSQKLDLVNAAVSRVFPLPLIMSHVAQALEDMLQALVMDGLDPNMVILQEVLEVILPWITLSEKVPEQTRALYAVSHTLRFICNFPNLLHMSEFSISGRLMGTLGLSCTSPHDDVCMGASEGLQYLFQILVLHRRDMKQKTEVILKELQKHFHGEWFVHLQDLTMFFRKYLTPEERADVIMVSLEAMANAWRSDGCAASSVLEMILKDSTPAIGKVSDIVEYIYHHLHSIPEATAQDTAKQMLHRLAQICTDEVILTLFKLQDQSPRGVRKPWEILASCPRGYQMILEHLLQRLMPHQKARGSEPGHSGEISPLIATRAIHELLLEPSQRTEVQPLFPSLFLALLFQTSLLVVGGGADGVQGHQHKTERTDPVSSTVEALKALMQSAGYGDHVSFIQKLGGWELLASPDRHYEGVARLARALVTKNCWHNRPVFSFVISVLQGLDYTNHVTALVFVAELLRCPDVAAVVDNVTVRILAEGFQSEDPAIVKPLLRVVETFAKHGNMAKQLLLLQPFVLKCCYSLDGDIVVETFLVLQSVVEHLTWQRSSSFLVQLAFTLGYFFEEESEQVRSAAFAIYTAVLAKVRRRVLVFPLKHLVLSLLVILVTHLQDRDASVAQNCRQALCHEATILGWSRLKAVFAEKDVWTILRALLRKEAGKALWFLRQSVGVFKSPQAPVRQVAVWFAGQIIQTLDADEASEVEEARTALCSMGDDPDPAVSCLATQILHVLEAKERMTVRARTSCFCLRRP